MADQTLKITNLPDSGSPFRVAFDLMARIAQEEYLKRGSMSPENPREYFLELYKLCRKEVGY